MPQYVVTPWKYHSELLEVRAQLFNQHDQLYGQSAEPADRRRDAVDQITAWGIRGGVPHAVESTGLLMDAVLLHERAGADGLMSVKLGYTAAFCRFVTGYCDISQTYGSKHSMYEIAKELQMPAAFIELRHEATHDRIPSLPRLARNSRLALGWLWEHYWSQLRDPSRPSSDKPTVEELPSEADCRTILNGFLSRRKTEIKGGLDGTGKNSASAEACVKLVNTCLGRRSALEVLCTTLVTEKMLVPSNRELGDSMNGAFTIWGNLLRRLAAHQKHFIGVLLRRLTGYITGATGAHVELDTFSDAVHAWAVHILQGEAWRHQDIVERVQGQRVFVIEECSMAPNVWAQKTTRAMIEGGDAQFRTQWGWLLTPELLDQVEV